MAKKYQDHRNYKKPTLNQTSSVAADLWQYGRSITVAEEQAIKLSSFLTVRKISFVNWYDHNVRAYMFVTLPEFQGVIIECLTG